MTAATRLRRDSAFAVGHDAERLEAVGRDIVHLELGQPDLSAPPAAIRALTKALAEHGPRYTAPAGDPVVRGQVAAHYTGILDAPVDADRIVLVPGSNLVLHFTLLAVADTGDEVLLPDPGFPPYAELVRLAGAVPVGYPADADPHELARLVNHRTRLLVVNSPNNPTGGVLPPVTVSGLVGVAAEHDLHILFDETYRSLAHGAPATVTGPVARYSRTIVMDSLSKSHSMCGWRIGIAVAPPELAKDMAALMTNTSCCMPAFVQQAVPAALAAGDWVARAAVEMRARRDFVLAELATMPLLRLAPPGGALYVFPDVRATGLGDREFSRRLLAEAGVAVVPGTTFGDGGAGHVRIAYTQPIERLAEGMNRVRAFLETLS